MEDEPISLLYPETNIFGRKLMNTLSEELTFPASGFLTFQFDIPFQLPIEDGQFIYTKKNQTALLYKQEEISINESQTSYFSKVEIVTILLEDLGRVPLDEKFHKYFDESLKYLNNIIQSIMLKYNYPEVRTLLIEDIPSVFLWFYTRNSKIRKQDFTCGIYIAKAGDSRFEKPEPIPSGELSRLINLADDLDNNKFIDALLYQRRAAYDFNHGKYQEAVIKANTFVEMAMYSFLTFIKKDSGESDSSIDDILKCGFKNILDHHLKPFFESKEQTFDRKDSTCKLGEYWKNTYSIRNKIVHEGIHFSRQESEQALRCATELVKECTRTLKSNPIDPSVYDFSVIVADWDEHQ